MGVLLTAPMPPRDANNNVLPLPPSAVYSLTVPEAGILHAVASGATAMSLLDASGTVITTGTSSLSTEISSPTSVVLVVENPTPGVITASLTSLVTYTERVSVIDFGADPTGTYDSTAAIQAAIDSMSNGGGSVFFPVGKYLCVNTLTLPAHVNLVGDHASLLPQDSSINFITYIGANLVGSTIIDGLTIDGSGMTSGGNSLLVFYNQSPNNIYINNITFLNSPGPALFIYSSSDVLGNFVIKNCYFAKCSKNAGPVLECANVGQSIIDNNIFENNISPNETIDFSYSTNGLIISNNTFNNNTGIAINSSGNSTDVNIHHNIITNNGFTGIYLYNDGTSSTNPQEHIVIDHNIIDTIPTTSIANAAIHVYNSSTTAPTKDIVISGNILRNLTRGGIDVDNVDGCVIINNIIVDVNTSDQTTADAAIQVDVSTLSGHIIISENVYRDNRTSPPTTYGFQATLPSGLTANNIRLINNDFAEATTPVNPQIPWGSGSVVKDNLGYNPYTVTTPAVPAASTSVTNTTGVDVDVYVSGGTAVTVSINGTSTGLADGAFYVPAGGTINLGAYTAAPTWVWVGR